MSVLEITSSELDGILGIDRSEPSEKPKKKASKAAKAAKKNGSGDPSEIDLEVEGGNQTSSKAKKSTKTKAMKQKNMTPQQKKMLDPSYAGAIEDDEIEFLIAQLKASEALRKKWGIVGEVTAKKIQKRISQNA